MSVPVCVLLHHLAPTSDAAFRGDRRGIRRRRKGWGSRLREILPSDTREKSLNIVFVFIIIITVAGVLWITFYFCLLSVYSIHILNSIVPRCSSPSPFKQKDLSQEYKTQHDNQITRVSLPKVFPNTPSLTNPQRRRKMGLYCIL